MHRFKRTLHTLPLAVALSGLLLAQDGERPFEMIEGEPMYTVLPLDGIPAIDKPEFVTAEEAFDFMADDEPVIGVVGADGTAKAYSAWYLDSHEIVNDVLDGHPIAATW